MCIFLCLSHTWWYVVPVTNSLFEQFISNFPTEYSGIFPFIFLNALLHIWRCSLLKNNIKNQSTKFLIQFKIIQIHNVSRQSALSVDLLLWVCSQNSCTPSCDRWIRTSGPHLGFTPADGSRPDGSSLLIPTQDFGDASVRDSELAGYHAGPDPVMGHLHYLMPNVVR